MFLPQAFIIKQTFFQTTAPWKETPRNPLCKSYAALQMALCWPLEAVQKLLVAHKELSMMTNRSISDILTPQANVRKNVAPYL